MDYQASSRREISGLLFQKTSLLFICLSLLFPASAFSQAVELTTDITITAIVPASPLVYPNTPASPPGPINMADTNDVAIFKGYAYPGSVVSLLKNGVLVTESPANPDGSFELRLKNLSAGTYSFGLRAEDPEKIKSKILLVTIYVSSNVTTLVDGIYLPPTITSDKVEVKKDENIIFTGRTSPNAEIQLSFSSPFDSETIRKGLADATGFWKYSMNSRDLKFGDYDVKARSLTKNSLSTYSDILTFRVGNENRLRAKISQLSGFRQKCDLNNDNRVNLLDFSIMAFWYKRLGFPLKVDLNTDNAINLTDLSILAYCWTG